MLWKQKYHIIHEEKYYERKSLNVICGKALREGKYSSWEGKYYEKKNTMRRKVLWQGTVAAHLRAVALMETKHFFSKGHST